MDESESVLFSVGLTCQHVSQAVDVHHVKRAVAQSVWSICAECLKERRMSDGEPVAPSDIWLCLKCGSQVSRCTQFVEVEFLKDSTVVDPCPFGISLPPEEQCDVSA